MSDEFLGFAPHRHGSAERSAVLLVNLGTPEAPDRASTRRFLAQFLRDPRVIEIARPIWLALLYGVILPLRSGRSAKAYRSVWTDQGSPLRVNSEALVAGVAAAFAARGSSVEVRLAMRYGEPSVAQVMRELGAQGLRRLIVLPLYPQYSATTTASVHDAVMDELRTWRWQPELRTITDYHREPQWLDAMAASIRRHWQQHPRGERLLFSFHGIPRRYFLAGDPYFCHCQYSAREIAARLDLAPEQWQVSFQSRVGREEWLRPYTDETIANLPKLGVKRLDVVCPGFAVDCLETLEEIAMQNAEAFIAAGGERLSYVPALNADAAHVASLVTLLERHGRGWPSFDPGWDAAHEAQRLAAIAARHDAFDHG